MASVRDNSAPFLGAWSLLAFETILPAGKVSKPFGDPPSGTILYLADGTMSAQISTGDQAKLSTDDFALASPEEALVAWRSYFGYWGTFKIDAERQLVTHHVEGSSFSNWIGTDQVRHFRFDGPDKLILEATFDSGRSVATWQRKSY